MLWALDGEKELLDRAKRLSVPFLISQKKISETEFLKFKDIGNPTNQKQARWITTQVNKKLHGLKSISVTKTIQYFEQYIGKLSKRLHCYAQ